MSECVIPGCKGKYNAKGYCHAHYHRLKRHGDPLAGRGPTPSRTRAPTMRDLEWAAGFLEGEGTFGVFGNGGEGVVAVQVNREPLDKLQAIFGGTIGTQKRRKQNPKHNLVWMWRAYGGRARGVGMTLYLFMSKKRRGQIRQMLTESTVFRKKGRS